MRQGGLILAAGRVRSKKKNIEKKKIRPTQNTPRHPQQPGDGDHLEPARDETRPTRFCPYSPASIDPRFVEIDPVQLSQSVKNDECYTYTDRHTDRQTDRRTDRPTN